MSRTINKVTLLGRVGTDPEMQYTQGGTALTKLRLATDRYRSNGDSETDDGQRRHRTEIHASEVVFLDGGNGNGAGQTDDSPFE